MARHDKTREITITREKPKGGADCAYCRSSRWTLDGWECKRGLAMDAGTCVEFRDSRMPSQLPDWTTRVNP